MAAELGHVYTPHTHVYIPLYCGNGGVDTATLERRGHTRPCPPTPFVQCGSDKMLTLEKGQIEFSAPVSITLVISLLKRRVRCVYLTHKLGNGYPN